jgi:hypothetical protein
MLKYYKGFSSGATVRHSMRQQPLHIACSLILLLLARTVSAQTAHRQDSSSHSPGAPAHSHRPGVQATQPPGPSPVKTTVDKREILIGEPIQFMLEATVPENTQLVWPQLDSLPHFDFLERGKTDSVIRTGERYYRQYLTITSFDSGAWSIPRLPFVMGAKKYFTDSVRIGVNYSKFDPSQDYHDIKDIIDVPNPFAKWIGWIVGGFTLLALVIVIWLVAKKKLLKKGSGVGAMAPRLSPYEEAVRQLDELQKQNAAENGPVKVYYTRLNDILRQFILRRLGIASLVETNEELIRKLRQLPIAPEEFTRLADTLRMSDFVKFAKYQPGVSDNEQNFTVIRSAVGTLEELARAREAERALEAAAVHVGAGAAGSSGSAGPQGSGERAGAAGSQDRSGSGASGETRGAAGTKDSERFKQREK